MQNSNTQSIKASYFFNIFCEWCAKHFLDTLYTPLNFGESTGQKFTFALSTFSVGHVLSQLVGILDKESGHQSEKTKTKLRYDNISLK